MYNQARPLMMHIDLNSCFATIEQQSRPLLRHRPVVILNRRTEHTAIVTASYEAKALGVKVGMKLTDARILCPDLVALESDPPKYRYVYHRLMDILREYSPVVAMKSIDEGVIDFSESVVIFQGQTLENVGREIKQRLKTEIGEYMRCNIGIGTNRFLAKTAAGFDKPDGLTEIRADNLRQMYAHLKLEDLTGIAYGYGRRLRQVGITTPLEFLDADEVTLEKMVFGGKPGRDWYQRLRGWEVDDVEYPLKSVGRQFVLDERGLSHEQVVRRFHGLSEDVAAKLRSQQVRARGVAVYAKSYDHRRWKQHVLQQRSFDDEQTLFSLVKQLARDMPLPVYEIGVTCYHLLDEAEQQLELFDDGGASARITGAIDHINTTWGARTVHAANTLGLGPHMPRKIPFGSTRYL